METEKLSKTKVEITKTGIYPVTPFKLEYKKMGEYETAVMIFQVQIGFKLACYTRKTIFFKGDKDRINKEINYLLKFVCEDCLKNTYTANNFKDYVNALANDVNKVIRRQMEEKTQPLLFAKVLRKKGSQFTEMPDFISQKGFEQQYLSFPDNVAKALYFTEWEIENTESSFAIIEKAAPVVNSDETINAIIGVTNWDNNDSLPF